METDGITLRGYRPGDLDALYALDVACFEKPFRFTRGAMRRFAEAANAQVVIAETQGELAGFCIVHMERVRGGHVGYVVTLDVAAAYRRQGLARRLMAEAERQAEAAGCNALALHVHTGNAAAIRFYAACGFVYVRPAQDFYGPGLDAAVWSKELSERRAPRTEDLGKV
jgi:ribosomal-protein-alanine N-acetyltransferase